MILPSKAIQNPKTHGELKTLPEILMNSLYHWIGCRENLQEIMVFPIKYRVFRGEFSFNPINAIQQRVRP